MTLKKQMYEDMESLFFDLDDATLELDFNGQTLMANQVTSRDSDYGFENRPEQGVLEERRAYYFRKIDLNLVPVPWEDVEINGETWTVLEVFPVRGAVKITFFRERA
jgi:hypothetical protein